MTVIVFDLETQKLAREVGGWGNIEALGLAVACTYDDDSGYRDWWEAQAADLIDTLRRSSLIVGFNISAFDFRVLSLYGDVRTLEEKAFDILDHIHRQTNKRVSLNSLAVRNLGEAKTFESGVHAIRLYRQGRLEELFAYCRQDVELTRKLFELWETAGILFVSGAEYVVWPGVKTAEDIQQAKEDFPQRRSERDEGPSWGRE